VHSVVTHTTDQQDDHRHGDHMSPKKLYDLTGSHPANPVMSCVPPERLAVLDRSPARGALVHEAGRHSSRVSPPYTCHAEYHNAWSG
jgi:hypothetical protein